MSRQTLFAYCNGNVKLSGNRNSDESRQLKKVKF